MSALVGKRPGLGGAASLAWSPHPRLRLALTGESGPSWRFCPDCGVPGVGTLDVRGTLVRHDAFNLAPWASGTWTFQVAWHQRL